MIPATKSETHIKNVPKEKLKFPNNRCVRNAWNVYEPSSETKALISEIGRNVYAEAFEFGPTQGIEDLRTLALQCLVATYTGGQFGQHLSDNDRILFGEHLDIELPVQNIVDLDVGFLLLLIFIVYLYTHIIFHIMLCRMIRIGVV